MTSLHGTTELIELRQYLLHPGQRDVLIDVFDREFVETQEAVGMAVLGQFRDPERPDYFVWLRGFPDMTSRHDSLTDFYGGPVWAQHRSVANATMIDSGNVFLLRAVTEEDRLPDHQPSRRDPRRVERGAIGIVVEATDEIDDEAIERFRSEVVPLLVGAGGRTLGLYATESSPNTFAGLPVRTDKVIVWIGAVDGNRAKFAAACPTSDRPQTRLVLLPTNRSALDATTDFAKRADSVQVRVATAAHHR